MKHRRTAKLERRLYEVEGQLDAERARADALQAQLDRAGHRLCAELLRRAESFPSVFRLARVPARLAARQMRPASATAASEPQPPEPPLPLSGLLDAPAEGDVLRRGAVGVSGWTLPGLQPAAAVEVFVNGTSAGRARLGLPRPDVQTYFHVPGALISGFEHLVDLTGLQPSVRDLHLELRARSADGETVQIGARTLQVAQGRNPSELGAAGSGRVVPARTGAHRDEALRLAVFTHDLGYGGGQLWLSELLRRAGAGTRFACTVVSPTGGPLVPKLESHGVHVHITQDYPVRELSSYEGRVKELALLLGNFEHNAVLVNTAQPFIGVEVADRLGCPAVWAIHESVSPTMYLSAAYPPGYVHPALQERFCHLLGTASSLVFEADATRQLFAPFAPPERSVVIRYGVDVEAIDTYRTKVTRDEARTATHLPSNVRVLLVMGVFEPRKAQTQLAAAYARVARDFPEALLVLVGDNAMPYAKAVSLFLEQCGITDRTMVLPVVDDTYLWYQAADVLVSASDLESLPRSVLESLAFELPVLAASVFGLPELLEDGRTGFLFEPRDLDALTAALRRVLSVPGPMLRDVARAGRALVDENGSAGYAGKIIALVEALRRDRTLVPAEVVRHRELQRARAS